MRPSHSTSNGAALSGERSMASLATSTPPCRSRRKADSQPSPMSWPPSVAGWGVVLINAQLAKRRKRVYTAEDRRKWRVKRRLRYWANPEAERAKAMKRYHADPEKHRERKRVERLDPEVVARQNARTRNRYRKDRSLRERIKAAIYERYHADPEGHRARRRASRERVKARERGLHAEGRA